MQYQSLPNNASTPSMNESDIDLFLSLTEEEIDYMRRNDPLLFNKYTESMRQIKINKARVEFTEFVKYVGRNSKTNAKLLLGPIHYAWADILKHQDRAVIWCHVESGKTNFISILYTLFKLGQNPNLTIAIVMATQDQASRTHAALEQYIRYSKELHEVFPRFKNFIKRTENAITIERDTIARDPSIQVCGSHGQILGARVDILIIDDIISQENVRTKESRDSVMEFYKSTLVGRLYDLVEDGKIVRRSQVIVIGTAWHPEDFMHTLANTSGTPFKSYRYPVADENGPLWPQQWPLERIAFREAELGPIEAQRQLYCQPWGDSEAVFKPDWINHCLMLGMGKTLGAGGLKYTLPGYETFTGVDFGISTKTKSDQTAIITIISHPDGKLEVLDIQLGRWHGPDILYKIREASARWSSTLILESNQAQQWMADFAKRDGLRAITYTTAGGTKSLPYMAEQLAAEMAGGGWIFPCGQREDGLLVKSPTMEALTRDLLAYHPQKHVPDSIAALLFARWGAKNHRQYHRNSTKPISTQLLYRV